MKKAFTLIELLIVVAIIGILAAIVIVNITGARAKTTRAQILANLNTAVKAYAACKSFATTAEKVAPVHEQTGIQVCSGSVFEALSDDTEKDTATASWPTWTDTNYAYATFDNTGITIAKVVNVKDNDMYVECSATGCTTYGGW